MMQEVYHCTPSEFYAQDHNIVDMHIELLNIKAKKNKIEAKRQEQKAKIKQ